MNQLISYTGMYLSIMFSFYMLMIILSTKYQIIDGKRVLLLKRKSILWWFRYAIAVVYWLAGRFETFKFKNYCEDEADKKLSLCLSYWRIVFMVTMFPFAIFGIIIVGFTFLVKKSVESLFMYLSERKINKMLAKEKEEAAKIEAKIPLHVKYHKKEITEEEYVKNIIRESWFSLENHYKDIIKAYKGKPTKKSLYNLFQTIPGLWIKYPTVSSIPIPRPLITLNEFVEYEGFLFNILHLDNSVITSLMPVLVKANIKITQYEIDSAIHDYIDMENKNEADEDYVPKESNEVTSDQVNDMLIDKEYIDILYIEFLKVTWKYLKKLFLELDDKHGKLIMQTIKECKLDYKQRLSAIILKQAAEEEQRRIDNEKDKKLDDQIEKIILVLSGIKNAVCPVILVDRGDKK